MTLEQAGIDISNLKAHSTTGVSVSVAASRDIIINHILQAADWNTVYIQKIYYKPVHDIRQSHLG